MTKRYFELPKEHELTKEQREILRLPKEGQYLIFGAPGTGKSIVALLRLKKYGDEKHIKFLTYNHVLNQHSKSLLLNQHEQQISTGFRWLVNIYSHLIKKHRNLNSHVRVELPKTEGKTDYQAIIDFFNQCKVDFNGRFLIIDEGQDFPVGWYEALQALNLEDFFVVADQNQQLTENNSNHQELQDVLGLEKKDVIYLTCNWRNTTPIAVFSNYFYTDKTSPLPAIPVKPSLNTPILYIYDKVNKVQNLVWNAYLRDQSKLICIIVSTNNYREAWLELMRNKAIEHKIEERMIQTYSSSDKEVRINFCEGGIVILNDMSVKGLEFDEVFIDLEGFYVKENNEEFLKKRIYVMSSRARERLFLLKKSSSYNSIEKLLPSPNESVAVEINGQISKIELLKRITL